ncbi:glycosyltransferase family 24 protein [Myriangium duriaei CBS 260.36]|uniref:Glycosyltransferase family 24 protein n=1 Tax=Myriangium duriaei CBS 260.36 TaxID=1168546 RepID=A0A9P4J245_9PEZI|nr:glycosyltransferase family 24 protein [Myriangium duriaei CBS 260.36]
MRPLNMGRVGQFLAAAAVLASSANAAAPTVDVALQAAFPAPPYLIELLETAAEENATAYFPLLDRIADGYFDGAKTDRELYDSFLKILQDDGHVSDIQALSTFKLALSIHSAVPRIAAHYQYYNTTAKPAGHTVDDCETWLLFDDKQYCTPDLSSPTSTAADGQRSLRGLPFDRIIGKSDNSPPSVLYADITSPSFRNFHKTISRTAKSGKSSYRVRYKPSASAQPSPLVISGYGVELALKRTDYIVIDDRAAAEGEEKKGKQAKTAVLEDDDEVADLKPLSSSELSQLGLKAATFVMNSEDKFATLLKLARDFPKHSSAIAAGEVSEELKTEMRHNAMAFLPPGYNALWVNGIQMFDRDLDVFSLLELLRRERKLISTAKALGLSEHQAIRLITHSAVTETGDQQQDIQRYDWRDDIEGNKVIIWMNDIEKDRRYFDWPDSVQALLQRTFPGQLPAIRKNIHNLIMPMDFSDKTDIALAIDSIQGFVRRGVPIRFGLVPIAQTKIAAQQAKIVYHLCETYGLGVALAYLESTLPDLKKATKAPIQSRFDDAIHEKSLRKDRAAASFQEVLDDKELAARVEDAISYLTRLGSSGPSAPYIVNGAPIARSDEWMQSMSNRVAADARSIQQGIYMGNIDEETDIAAVFLENASSRRNALIIPEDEKDIKIFDFSLVPDLNEGLIGSVPSVEASESSIEPDFVQMFVIADFDSETGWKLFRDALFFRKEHDNVQLYFFASSPGQVGGFTQKLDAVLSKGAGPQIEELESLKWTPAPKSHSEDHDDEAPAFSWRIGQHLLHNLELPVGSSAIIFNSRVIGPIPQTPDLTFDDLEMLLAYERKKRYTPAVKALENLKLQHVASSPARFSQLTNFIALSQKSDTPEGIFEGSSTLRISIFDKLQGEHSGFEVGDITTSSVQLVFVVDLASESAQRWIPIVQTLSELSGVHTKVFLNPKESLEELPIKRFYRHVLKSEPTFDPEGKVHDPSAHFNGLPADALLTIGMDLPPAWLVSPKESVHDLDNLRLSSLKGESVTAIYELDHILIEGHSKDTTDGQAPRGAQLVLSTGDEDRFADTIVMANLGYFQFKANPGFYDLSLKQGRSQEVFQIDSAGLAGNVPTSDDASKGIALTSFRGTTLYPRLSRKPGMENEDVLEPSKTALESTLDTLADTAGGVLNAIGLDAKSAGGWLSKASQKVASLSNSGPSSKAISTLPHADINIFSVASGHLYERMLNIMMLSVMKHTSHTVKFWFIEQFLSPSFKSFLPLLAEEYGFRYEMVTFKWPHWLRSQKEKQREIWGYKILFLDVLFPLDLDKVIFVDADQIVRTDMYELVQFDLQGAPYGFTPMCDSRTEMEGFRFWKQGYWKNFLRGLPYHISALYVVDLAKFRQMAAGDRLRQQYHQLSADPGSLSNLDQDLPNHMQHVLPIHSLPQEWLWCETWCSDESLGVAKTIDLCNNPQTKEPKLERARRQVPEWTVYDDEIAAVAKRKAGEDASLPGLGEGKGEQERLQAEEYKKKLEEEKAKESNRKRDEL